ncbi:MAG: SMC family ATPase [Staphylothermus sp.]|nr:SMC family ATPase [Staphylothermus sp.]
MIILGIRLKNIRSYTDKSVVFPSKGVTVIYGDVGTGKSTILTSIAYALFGQPRRAPSNPLERYAYPKAEDLLRVGSREGSVRLLIRQGKKLILVERRLRREASGSVRDPGGSITVYEQVIENGEKKLKLVENRSYTSTELKRKIMQLLGIPETITREKPLIFTNAIYVPQFSVHDIINLSKDDRTLLINTALNINKYTYAKKNIEELASGKRSIIGHRIENLRREEKTLEAWIKTINIEELKSEVKKLKSENDALTARKKSLEEKTSILKQELEELEKLIEETRSKKEEVENQLAIIQNIKRELEDHRRRLNTLLREINITSIEELPERIKKLVEEKKQVKTRLENLMSEREEIEKEIENLEKRIEEISNRLDESKKELHSLIGEKASEERMLTKMEKEIAEIKDLINKGICPVCRQKITHEHGYSLLREKENEKNKIIEKISVLKKKVENVKSRITSLEEEKNSLKNILLDKKKVLRKTEDEIRDLNNKKLRLEELIIKSKNINELVTKIREYSEKIANEKELLDKKDMLEEQLEKLRNKKTMMDEEMEMLREDIGRIEKQIASNNARIEEIEKRINEYEVVSRKLVDVKKRINILESMARFLYGYGGRGPLYQLISLVEDRVRSIAYGKFRALFIEYFLRLMEGHEIISVDLDPEFKPVIRVRTDRGAGEITQPSGGQLTSVSLAYRLALNAVARGMTPQLRKSTLILDEPTYGFSPERVEKLRELLMEISSGGQRQIIVVTHDRTLLSIGDCKIRLSIDPGLNETKITYEECTISDEYREFVENMLYKKPTNLIMEKREEHIETRSESFKPVFRTKKTSRGKSIFDYFK